MVVVARLYQEAGAWGLPSTCPSCIATNAILRIDGVQVDIEPGTASPAMTQTGALPVVVVDRAEGDQDDLILAGLQAVRSHPSTKVDAALTRVQAAESVAFIAMVEAALAPVRFYEWFELENNYLAVVRPAYVGHLSFPLSVLASRSRRSQVRASLGVIDPEEMYNSASECLQSLSVRLGDRKAYFYGDEPTVLDAVVYGYLSLFLFAPLLESRFRSLLADYPNLIQATRSFGAKVFPAESVTMEESRPEIVGTRAKGTIPRTASEAAAKATSGKPSTSNPEPPLPPKEQQRQQRNRLFVIITVASFLGYALFGTELEFEGLEFDTS